MKHTYYQLVLKLSSPLSIGSGSDAKTDSDVICRKNGTPYIPATAIAGTFRHYISDEDRKDNKIFGYINDEDSLSSSVIFYDGKLKKTEDGEDSSYFIAVRDSVSLKDKVGEPGAKFDFQIVETDAEFVTYIEVDKYHEDICSEVEKMIAALDVSEIRMGRKTSRGYGMIKVQSVKKAEFDFENEDEKNKWLDFDALDEKSWEHIPEFKTEQVDPRTDTIKLELKQKGAVSIREYTTSVNMPDYRHISLHNGTFVIPGTSWAGAFRERFKYFADFADIDMTEELFGIVDKEKNKTKPSQITFSESVIKNGKKKLITRNSIDRFSAAAKDGALYTELTCYNGTTELIITIPKVTTEKKRAVLSAVILDLNSGLLSVGGLTAVGRGIFEVTGLFVNGDDRTDMLKNNDIKNMLVTAVKED